MRAIIAALPREIAGLVRGLQPDAALRGKGIHLYRTSAGPVICAGMGGARVALAVEAALAQGCEELVSVGLAGACSDIFQPGTVAAAGCVIDALSGERFSAASEGVTLVTSHAIAGVQEKARLHAAYGAAMVDMEAATVARLAQAHGVRFRALKAISDGHDFEMAHLGKFAGPRGEFRTRAFALHTALRPGLWRPTMHLGRRSSQALARLWEELRRDG